MRAPCPGRYEPLRLAAGPALVMVTCHDCHFDKQLRLDRGNLRAGRVIGYLPVPPSNDGLVPEAVVDLTYRATLDRLDIVRVANISNGARAELRYVLTRHDTLRTPSVGYEIEAVVGARSAA